MGGRRGLPEYNNKSKYGEVLYCRYGELPLAQATAAYAQIEPPARSSRRRLRPCHERLRESQVGLHACDRWATEPADVRAQIIALVPVTTADACDKHESEA